MKFNSSYIQLELIASQTFRSVTFCTTYTTIAPSVIPDPELKPLYIYLDMLLKQTKACVPQKYGHNTSICSWVGDYSFSPFPVVCEDQNFLLFFILEVSFDFLLLGGMKNLRLCSIREDTKEIENTLAKIKNNHDRHHQPKF